ncbi:hypothetical protein L1987_74266 [Smallanthus sonchifolius]|uniref:Uncharacterized protein n=1 Tax=Smallanthus sonchifolius TaxID=185202 RepID=A0ACB9A271_9ASTR|nr:hypothetical protein L1987_74266 [Smallanthus sonchifolius]
MKIFFVQLQMRLQQEELMRMLLERALGRTSSTLSPGPSHSTNQVSVVHHIEWRRSSKAENASFEELEKKILAVCWSFNGNSELKIPSNYTSNKC